MLSVFAVARKLRRVASAFSSRDSDSPRIDRRIAKYNRVVFGRPVDVHPSATLYRTTYSRSCSGHSVDIHIIARAALAAGYGPHIRHYLAHGNKIVFSPVSLHVHSLASARVHTRTERLAQSSVTTLHGIRSPPSDIFDVNTNALVRATVDLAFPIGDPA